MDFETLEITYGGKPMLAPDPAGELVAHIQQHFSHFFEPANPLTYASSNLRQTCCDNRPPLVLPRWNQEPRLGLYQYYIPLSLLRPSKVYGLVKCEEDSIEVLSVSTFKVETTYIDSSGKKTKLSRVNREMEVDGAVEITRDVTLVRLIDADYSGKMNRLFLPSSSKPSRMTLSEFVDLLGYEVFNSWYKLRRATLSLLPSVYVDLDSLWRPGELAAVLLEAALGVYATSPTLRYELGSGSFLRKIDAAFYQTLEPPRQNNRRVRVAGITQVNGRKKCDKAVVPFGLDGPVVQTSAVTATGLLPSDFANIVREAEGRYWAGPGYRRLYVDNPGVFADVPGKPLMVGYDSSIVDLNPAGGGQFESFIPVQAFPVQRHYYWITEEKPTCEPEDVIRVQLLEDMPVCGDAAAFHLSDLAEAENCPCGPVKQVLLVDTAGIARSRVRDGQRYAPAQSMGFAKQLRCGDTGEANVYELISVGQGCCPEPGSSVYEPCCNQWFTRYDNLGTVTEKAVGAEISYGETIGQLKGFGASELKYKAYLANSDAYDGCAIDLSGVHAFGTKNSRASGTSPCSPGFDQCAIDYALLKMSGRLPVDPGACKEWYEDLAAAGDGNDYFRRTIESNPENCSYSKKVYNFTNSKTTILTKGADYIVLKHWCDPTSSVSSSSGVDACCVILTDYDMRCVGGRLQRWKQETEVCWNGDCLEKRISRPWFYTGEQAGCCDCGSGSSSVGSSGSGSGGTGCVDGVTVVSPSTGYQSGGTMWDITSSSYDMGTGNWSVSAVANANAGAVPSCAANVSCTVQANAASNPAVTSCLPGSGLKCQGDTITISGTSTPPTSGNCGTWAIQAVVNNITFFDFSFDCAECISVGTCCSGLQLPPTLTAVITGGSSCDGTISLTYDGTAWRGGSLDLSCSGGIWYMQYESEAVSPTVTCNPFSAVGVFAPSSTSCTGGFTVTIAL